MNKNAFKILLGLGIVGLIAGSFGMWVRIQHGHLPMAYGSYVPWGLWVAFDIFFLGLTGGAYMIAILTYGFGIKQFERLGPLSVFTLLLSLLCEGIIISLDLGQPLKIYRFLLTPNFASMLTWLVIFIVAMWLNYLPWFYFLLRDHRKDRSKVRILALINIPIGFIFFIMQGAFFAVMLNRPLWSDTFTPVLSVAGSFLSGSALVTALAAFCHQDRDVVGRLAQIVRVILIIFLALEAVQFLIGYQTDIPGTVTALNMIVFGQNWWVFWMIHFLVGSLVPLYFLSFRHESNRSVAWSCLLIVLTFLAVRYNAIIPDLAAYNLEGLDAAFVHHRLSRSYTPSIAEWLVSLWVVSLWLVVFMLGTRWLPVVPEKKGGEQHVA